MLVREAEELKTRLEANIRCLVNNFEEATDLIVEQIYVNRTNTVSINGEKESHLNSIECEVRLK